MIWGVLYVVAALLLLLHWGRRNAVWGSATLGAIVGFIIALIRGFDWWIVGKSISVAVLIGTAFEWLPLLLQRLDESSKRRSG